MKSLGFIIVVNLVVILEIPRFVSCDGQMHPLEGSKSVRKRVQKVAAFFFGCNGLDPGTAEVNCTNFIDKLTQGVNCTVKVPLGTRAVFKCPGDMVLDGPVSSIRCKFPGKWEPVAPKCVKQDMTTTVAVTTTAAVTAVKTTNTSATTTNTSTTTSPTTASSTTTSKPLIFPIATKVYAGVGNLSLFQPLYSDSAARAVCKSQNTNLLYVNSSAANDAAKDLLTTNGFADNTKLWTDIIVDPALKKYSLSDGTSLSTVTWCPGQPELVAKQDCTVTATNWGCVHDEFCDLQLNFICQW